MDTLFAVIIQVDKLKFMNWFFFSILSGEKEGQNALKEWFTFFLNLGDFSERDK